MHIAVTAELACGTIVVHVYNHRSIPASASLLHTAAASACPSAKLISSSCSGVCLCNQEEHQQRNS
eukprot:10121-Heterococcus_DN1.PRE.1